PPSSPTPLPSPPPLPPFPTRRSSDLPAVHAARIQSDRAPVDFRLALRSMSVDDRSIAVPDFGPEAIAVPLLPARHDAPRVAVFEIGRAHVNSSHVAISYAVFCLKKKK